MKPITMSLLGEADTNAAGTCCESPLKLAVFAVDCSSDCGVVRELACELVWATAIVIASVLKRNNPEKAQTALLAKFLKFPKSIDSRGTRFPLLPETCTSCIAFPHKADKLCVNTR
jgi:hypothetical protein